jgi:uncharacterized membrane protein YjjP (DUF1212 family)
MMEVQKSKYRKITRRSARTSQLTEIEKMHTAVQNFLNTAMSLGQEFLTCGGSVHRLEVLVSLSGEVRGYETHVQATPSSLIISCFFAKSGKSFVRSKRINAAEISLIRLRGIDKLLQQFSNNLISEKIIQKNIKRLVHLNYKKSITLRSVSLAGIGLSACILNGGNPYQAAIAGLITVLVLIIGGHWCSLYFRNYFLKVFFLSSLSLLGATVVSYMTGWPSLLFAIGTFAYVVPGLLMTTAISEIVDQHYLSGSIRILKAIVVFLAMGMAYFIFADFTKILKLPDVLAPILKP